MKPTVENGSTIIVSRGRLLRRNPNYGLRVNCYACGQEHAASEVVRIEDGVDVSIMPLCGACSRAEDSERAVVQKFWGLTGLTIAKANAEEQRQFDALMAFEGGTEQ